MRLLPQVTVSTVRWPQTVSEAEALQLRCAGLVALRPLPAKVQRIAAVDADYRGDRGCAAAASFSYRTMLPEEERVVRGAVRFPYRSGFLSFREIPLVLPALQGLSVRPDVVLVDGQGIAHPRRFGLASHLGVITGIPTIGCAKSWLTGSYVEPGWHKGDWSPLEVDGQVVGAAVRTRDGVQPVFVSPGHLITLEESIAIVLVCCTEFRLPQPLRRADFLARAALKREEPAPAAKLPA